MKQKELTEMKSNSTGAALILKSQSSCSFKEIMKLKFQLHKTVRDCTYQVKDSPKTPSTLIPIVFLSLLLLSNNNREY